MVASTRWHTEFRTSQNVYVMQAPSGFRFFFNGLEAILDALEVLVGREGYLRTALNEPILITSEGIMTIVTGDHWENPNFTGGQEVTNVVDLTRSIVMLLRNRIE